MQAHQLAASCIIKLCATATCGRGGTPGGAAGCPSGTAESPAPALDAPPPFDQWLENLIREAHERGYSDTLVDQTLDRPQAAAARHPERPRSGRARRRIRPVLSCTHQRAVRAAGTRDGPPQQRTALERRKEIRGSATIRPRHLGDRNALRPREGQYARLPGAGHAGVGAATVRLLSRRAVRRVDDGVAGTHRCRKR